ncbi:MAG: HpcH/HpaI aldolase family protein [Nitrososphaerales archaeon]
MFFENSLKKKLRRGDTVFGAGVSISNSEIPEILSLVPFDFFQFDMEHGPLNLTSLEGLLQTTAAQITPIVRVPTNDALPIRQVLDAGAYGTMIPMVNSGDEALRAVKSSKYPPMGTRGMGARRAASYYSNSSDYIMRANEETMVIPMIETREGVQNAEEIISTKGVDAWFVGINDLAASLGHVGEPHSQAVSEAMNSILQIGKKADVAGGTLARSPEEARTFVKGGHKLILLGSDVSFLLGGAKSILAAVKA